jgi:hypothetical protein
MPKPDVVDVDTPIPYSLSPWQSNRWWNAPTCCCLMDLENDLVVCKECGTIYFSLDQIASWVKVIL